MRAKKHKAGRSKIAIAFAALLAPLYLLLKEDEPTHTPDSSETNASPHSLQQSPDPLQRLIESGNTKSESIERDGTPRAYTRTRLVTTEGPHPYLRIVERWTTNPQQKSPSLRSREAFVANQLLVRLNGAANFDQLRALLHGTNLRLGKKITATLCTVESTTTTLDTLPQAIAFLTDHPEIVDTAEGDGYGFGGGDPDDSRFDEQWALKNTGQNGGTPGADVNASEFWETLENAPNVVIAVLDSGLNFHHPDLQNIAWVNPHETPQDNRDNDQNGWTDDINGWDFVNDDNDPSDDHGHGSNVTGIIAANRNNGTGVVGMLSSVQILSCKILNSENGGATSDLISGLRYARRQNASVMNLSLQNYPYSQIVDDEISLCQEQGIILSICGGNQGRDNDISPNYPSSYPHPNIISVANHDRHDQPWTGSFNPTNFGKERIDLFAPGRLILSPILNSSYSSYTGTSQAAPFVTSVAAAIKQINPEWGPSEIKSAILDTVTKQDSYQNLCLTSGRLNAAAALSLAILDADDRDSDNDGFSNRFELAAGTRIDQTHLFPKIVTQRFGDLLRTSVTSALRDDIQFTAEKSNDLQTWTTEDIVTTRSLQSFHARTLLSNVESTFIRFRPVEKTE